MTLSEEFIRGCRIWSNNLITGMKSDSWAHISEHWAQGAAELASFWKDRQPPICHEDELK